jgi:hypothetical protein
MNSAAFENNYRKIYALRCVHMPFNYFVVKIRSKWGIKEVSAKSYKEASDNAVAFNKTLEEKTYEYIRQGGVDGRNSALLNKKVLDIPQPKKGKVIKALLWDTPFFGFESDINALLNEFNLRKEWHIPIEVLVVSDFLSCPLDYPDSDAPSKAIYDQINILHMTARKEVQHDKLKERGVIFPKKTPIGLIGEVDIFPYLDKNYIRDEFGLDQDLIKTDLEIFQQVFGTMDEDDFHNDKKNIKKVRNHRDLLRKSPYYQSLSKHDVSHIDQLLQS